MIPNPNIAERASSVRTAMFGLGIILSLVVVCIRLFGLGSYPRLGNRHATRLADPLPFVALGNFVVLLAVFSHSRGISLANLEE